MTDVIAGQTVTLLSQWYDFQGGSLVDLDASPSISIANVGTGAIALTATTSGVTHPGTGSYGYAWSSSLSLPAGSYLATWSGLKAGAPVTAAETITVTAAGSPTALVPAEIWYCTREDVKRALDYKESARNNAQVDRAIAAVSRAIENNCHRIFYPTVATRYFDWPNYQYAYAWKLYLDQNDLISVTALFSGGVAVQPGAYNLEPVNSGPPYTRVEMNLGSSSSFNAGSSTFQRSIAITGLWGHGNAEAPAGAVATAANASVTTVQVTDSSSIDVGQLLRVGTERLIVTEKGMLTTGQTLQTPLTAQQADNIVHVTAGSSYTVGEVLLLDSEHMLITDIAGNSLTVRRAWDGPTLAAHTGSTIYAPRSLTVVRGVLGTAAASMSQGDPIVKWTPPSLIRQLTIGEAINNLQQEATGYARTVGNAAGSGNTKRAATIEGLLDLRDLTYSTYTRKARKRAV